MTPFSKSTRKKKKVIRARLGGKKKSLCWKKEDRAIGEETIVQEKENAMGNREGKEFSGEGCREARGGQED